jgi:hypothetical protein
MRFFSLIAILAAAVLAVLVDDAADLNPRQVEASSHQNNGRWAGCSCLGWPFSNVRS